MNKRTVICLFPNERIRRIEGFRQKYINHPGKDVPFHITLLNEFYHREEITDNIISSLYKIASKTKQFAFEAVPISTFPTSNVIYLNPIPVSPIEKLVKNLCNEFPEFSYNEKFPVFHMTIAYNYPDNLKDRIISKFLDKFGSKRIPLTAGRIGICIQEESGWKEYLSFKLGEYDDSSST
ncbi:MAG: 2'-5' RNA ligase family protein [Clostridiales bacterium]|nr:2'-5' RNA ligase family protein [Clostridiales bacterium]